MVVQASEIKNGQWIHESIAEWTKKDDVGSERMVC